MIGGRTETYDLFPRIPGSGIAYAFATKAWDVGADLYDPGSERKETKTDTVLLILVLLLAVFGLVMLFSISEYNGRVRFGDSAYYFKKQLFATALGLMTMYIVVETDYRFFVRLAPAAISYLWDFLQQFYL